MRKRDVQEASSIRRVHPMLSEGFVRACDTARLLATIHTELSGVRLQPMKAHPICRQRKSRRHTDTPTHLALQPGILQLYRHFFASDGHRTMDLRQPKIEEEEATVGRWFT